MLTMQKQDSPLPAEFRISASETMQNKLLYQIHTGQFGDRELAHLQKACYKELHQLRSELDVLLDELRLIVSGGKKREALAA
ncbi:hypothetical protein [Paenibacillus sp. NFR01]|uniref:hypothetical protein n=1 Tax=Paenibacillus sp. NFR01 TaxID=1566279 RepID=UPI0008B30420|nr:hypothetical protein [Paenibacillus sp. NFR01]SEU10858.1 hypothetical protein SAMN03159358_3356 [Paenibacillus sp. NFR01]